MMGHAETVEVQLNAGVEVDEESGGFLLTEPPSLDCRCGRKADCVGGGRFRGHAARAAEAAHRCGSGCPTPGWSQLGGGDGHLRRDRSFTWTASACWWRRGRR